MDEKTLFVELSMVLTGEGVLPADVAGEYLDRFKKEYPIDLSRLLKAFDSVQQRPDLTYELSRVLRQDQALGQAARRLITLWYTAELKKADGSQVGPETEKQYQSALMYGVIGAPAPGFTQAGYGYWQIKPELD
jgi:hypothetical protein